MEPTPDLTAGGRLTVRLEHYHLTITAAEQFDGLCVRIDGPGRLAAIPSTDGVNTVLLVRVLRGELAARTRQEGSHV
jgi:hypothetical protein